MNPIESGEGEPVMALYLLGPPALTCQARPFPLPRRQARALLFRLAVDGQPVPREELADLFWPDKPPPTARRNLTRLLSYLRRQLPEPDLLEVNKTAVALNLNLVTSDVMQFRERCQTDDPADWETAVSLYGGSFLAGFFLSNSSEFDNWLSQEQFQLERLYLETLRRLVQAHSRKPSLAIPFAQKYLAIDDLAEDIHRWLITLYSASGDRRAAMRQYEHCVLVLEQELGVSPLPETNAVHDAVRRGGSLTVRESRVQQEWMSLPGADVPLVGRERALATLDEAYGRFRSGGVIFLSGEAGAGKSRLMQTFANGCRALVLGGNSYAESGSIPYQPLVQAMRLALAVPGRWQGILPIWLAELSRLLPELSAHFSDLPKPLTVDPQQAQARLFEALRQLFSGLATASPLLLCLDDIHWADDSTKEWLLYFTRQLRGSQVCILAAYRSSEQQAVASWQWALKRAGLMTTLTLEGLSTTAVSNLLRQLDTNFPNVEQLARRIHSATRGNPFFLLETTREIIARKAFTSDSANLPLSPTVRDAILHRASDLTPLAHQIVEVTAVLSPIATLDLIAETAGRGKLETATALEELTQRQLLRTDDNRFHIQHDLAREVLYQEISQWRRQLLHQRAANALQNSPATNGKLAVIAFHFSAANKKEQAIDYYCRAAEEATAIYAHQEAAQHMHQALLLANNLPDGVVELWQLHETLADKLLAIADYAVAESNYKEALTLTSEADILTEARLEHKLAQTFLRQNQPTAAEATCRKALARLKAQPPPHLVDKWHSLRLAVHLQLALVLYRQLKLAAMRQLEQETQTLLATVGTNRQRSQHLGNRVRIALVQNRFQVFPEMLQNMRSALTFAQESGNLSLITQQTFLLGFLLLWYGKDKEAETHLQRSLADSRKIGELTLENLSLTYLIVLHRRRGAFADVARLFPQSVELSELVGDEVYLGTAQANRAWLYYRKGEQRQAFEQARLALLTWANGNYPFRWLASWVLLIVAMEQDDLPEAINAGRIMLHPKQQKLPDEIKSVLQTAVSTWEKHDIDGARTALETAVVLAKQHSYL